MAFLYITEYERFGKDEKGFTVPAPYVPPLAEQKWAISGTSQPSTGFQDNTRLVEIHCDVICHIAWTTFSQMKAGTPTAATITNKRLPAGSTQFFTVAPGAVVSVIEGT